MPTYKEMEKRVADLRKAVSLIPARAVLTYIEPAPAPGKMDSSFIPVTRESPEDLRDLLAYTEAYVKLARSMEETVDNVREALGLAETHYLVIADDVAAVVKREAFWRGRVVELSMKSGFHLYKLGWFCSATQAHPDDADLFHACAKAPDHTDEHDDGEGFTWPQAATAPIGEAQ